MPNDQSHDPRVALPANRLAQAVALSVAAVSSGGGGGSGGTVSNDYPALSMLSVNNYTTIFAASTGTPGGTGAENDPMDLETALQALCSGAADWLYIKDMITPATPIDLTGLGGSGTAGHPIVVTNFNAGAGIDFTNGQMTFDSQNRWLIEGLTTQNSVTAFNFGAQGSPDQQTHYFTFRNLVSTMTGGGDNSGVIAASGCDYIGVINSTITGPGAAVHGNTACIYITLTPHSLIENNELSNAPQLIYLKHVDQLTAVNGGQIVRNNWLKGSVGVCRFAARGGIFINNISEVDVNWENGGGGDPSINNTVENNTLLAGKNFAFGGNGGADSTGNTVRNNIMHRLQYNRYSARTDYTQISDYNLIGDTVFWAGNDLMTLASWQSLKGDDLNSVAGVPTFVGGATPTTAAGYALATGSAGKGAGLAGADMGADVSLVGVQ